MYGRLACKEDTYLNSGHIKNAEHRRNVVTICVDRGNETEAYYQFVWK